MRLKITKLFGEKDIDLELNNKINVLIGDNGSGKSTILNIIKYLLSGDLVNLSKLEFNDLVFELGDSDIEMYQWIKGKSDKVDKLVCKVKREDIIPLNYVLDAKFRVILRSYLYEYDYLKDIEMGCLNFERFMTEFIQKFNHERTNNLIDAPEIPNYYEDFKMFFSNQEEYVLPINNKKITCEPVEFQDVKYASYASSSNLKVCYGSRMYLYNLYLSFIKINICKLYKFPMDISLKVLNSSLPTSVHEVSCNLCQGLNYQDFNLIFKSLSIEEEFNDFLCIKKDDCFQLVYIQNDFGLIGDDKEKVLLMEKRYNLELEILKNMHLDYIYDDYVRFNEKDKYDWDNVLSREGFVKLIKDISVAPNSNFIRNIRENKWYFSEEDEYLPEQLDKFYKIMKFISKYKKIYKFEENEYTIEDYSSLKKNCFYKDNRDKDCYNFLEIKEKEQYSREKYVLDYCERPNEILFQKGQKEYEYNIYLLCNLFLSNNIIDNILKLDIEKYLDTYSTKMFEELTSKYFIGKRFKLDFDEDFNIKLIIQNIKNGNNIDVSMLSSGEYKILRIIKRIVFTKSRYIFLLDEPELSLSIFWQSMLLDDILKFGKQNKTIIATQSPYLINEKQIKYLVEVK